MTEMKLFWIVCNLSFLNRGIRIDQTLLCETVYNTLPLKKAVASL